MKLFLKKKNHNISILELLKGKPPPVLEIEGKTLLICIKTNWMILCIRVVGLLHQKNGIQKKLKDTTKLTKNAN